MDFTICPVVSHSNKSDGSPEIFGGSWIEPIFTILIENKSATENPVLNAGCIFFSATSRFTVSVSEFRAFRTGFHFSTGTSHTALEYADQSIFLSKYIEFNEELIAFGIPALGFSRDIPT